MMKMCCIFLLNDCKKVEKSLFDAQIHQLELNSCFIRTSKNQQLRIKHFNPIINRVLLNCYEAVSQWCLFSPFLWLAINEIINEMISIDEIFHAHKTRINKFLKFHRYVQLNGLKNRFILPNIYNNMLDRIFANTQLSSYTWCSSFYWPININFYYRLSLSISKFILYLGITQLLENDYKTLCLVSNPHFKIVAE